MEQAGFSLSLRLLGSEKYAQLASPAQLRLVESLTPSTPPHVKYASKRKNEQEAHDR